MDWSFAIAEAQARIAPHIRRTPVILADLPGLPEMELKLEHLQHTGSFKPRGAFNTLLSRPVPAAGVVAASGGNHGAALGHAARALGYPARIFVPELAGPAKIALIRATGADLTVVPGVYDNALAAARAHEAETGALQVHAFDAPATVVGQGTLFAEWEDQGLSADTVLIAVGGGGLIGGAAAWLGTRRRIIAVEPANAPTLNRALAEGPETEVAVSGVAANALGARKIGRIGYDLCREANVTSVLVADQDITAAQALLWRALRQWVEPGGATALAALNSGVYRPEPGERIAVLVCGANPAPDPLAETQD
ncbi:MAG TPA: threonine/serine dehydratase [Albidovulum sp.]|uniref:threonine/serine dehydratase n=1 Tax=Albidovulum sp. TaxID=1872424 RepID=UPI002C190DF0|nr:threonine/serine dehydratase [Albidovulum sp.]